MQQTRKRAVPAPTFEPLYRIKRFGARRSILLCKFICKAPVSGTKQLDNHHFVGNATGIMPV